MQSNGRLAAVVEDFFEGAKTIGDLFLGVFIWGKRELEGGEIGFIN